MVGEKSRGALRAGILMWGASDFERARCCCGELSLKLSYYGSGNSVWVLRIKLK